MKPISFAKLLLRLGATLFLSLFAISQLVLIIPMLTQPDLYMTHTDLPEMVLALSACALKVVFIVLIWLFAGPLARFFVPRDCDLTPDPFYRQYEQAGFWLIGGYCLLRALRGFDVAFLGNNVVIDNPSMAPIYFCLAILLIFGLPGLLADAVRRAPH